MILRSIGFCLIFLVTYLFMVNQLQWPSQTVNQWEDNNRLVERFLFANNPEKISTVIVGSSMSFRLSAQKMPVPDSVYNLSLGGQSIYEGLEIVRRSNHLPKYLLIESNLIHRPPKTGYVDGIFVSGLYKIKETFDGFRYQYRPITFIQYLYYGIKNRIPLPVNFSLSANEMEIQHSVDNEDNEIREAIANQMEMESTETHQVDLLAAYVDYFMKAGVEVIFFEMPTALQSLQSTSNKQIRSTLNRSFPQNRFIEYQKLYPTMDGIHITVSDANDYLNLLLKKISE